VLRNYQAVDASNFGMRPMATAPSSPSARLTRQNWSIIFSQGFKYLSSSSSHHPHLVVRSFDLFSPMRSTQSRFVSNSMFYHHIHLGTRVSSPGYTARLNSQSRGCRNYICYVSTTPRIPLHLRHFSTWYARNRSVSSWSQTPSTLGIWNVSMHHSSMVVSSVSPNSLPCHVRMKHG
jgi:hypothetical protein